MLSSSQPPWRPDSSPPASGEPGAVHAAPAGGGRGLPGCGARTRCGAARLPPLPQQTAAHFARHIDGLRTRLAQLRQDPKLILRPPTPTPIHTGDDLHHANHLRPYRRSKEQPVGTQGRFSAAPAGGLRRKDTAMSRTRRPSQVRMRATLRSASRWRPHPRPRYSRSGRLATPASSFDVYSRVPRHPRIRSGGAASERGCHRRSPGASTGRPVARWARNSSNVRYSREPRSNWVARTPSEQARRRRCREPSVFHSSRYAG